MAMVERMMGLKDDGTVPADSRADAIAAHRLHALLMEVIAGRLTAAAVKNGTHLNIRTLADESGKSDNDDWTALAALLPGIVIPGSPTALEKALRLEFVNSVHSVQLLAEIREAGYTTPAMVRAKLGI